jgi:hypothetical protein
MQVRDRITRYRFVAQTSSVLRAEREFTVYILCAFSCCVSSGDISPPDARDDAAVEVRSSNLSLLLNN